MPKIQSLKVRAVRVPMTHPHRTASGVVSGRRTLLTDVLTDDGVDGHSMVFTYTAAALRPTSDLIQNLQAAGSGRATWPPVEMQTEAFPAVLDYSGPKGLSASRWLRSTWRFGTRWLAGTAPRWSVCSAVSKDRFRPMGQWDTTGRRARPGSRPDGSIADSRR